MKTPTSSKLSTKRDTIHYEMRRFVSNPWYAKWVVCLFDDGEEAEGIRIAPIKAFAYAQAEIWINQYRQSR